jgi:acetylornithine deacetylase/succinyl-diaminopimelate desuccinylase-like protein
LYSHYDVQPVDPLADWGYSPFAATARDGVIYGRGICDDKADIASRLHALCAWREANGELPFDVVWLSEGAEEVGSPGLESVCTEHADTLRADGCLWESYLRRADGTPEIAFGCKGLLYLQLTVRALSSDQHSSFAGVFRSAPFRLVQAIQSLVGFDGRPAVDGLGQLVMEPSMEELAALASVELPDESAAALPGESAFLNNDSEDLWRRLYFEPSINISGLTSGFQGGGSKTVLPATASAKVDFRLMPGQYPEDVYSLVEAHLRSRGFDDVKIKVLSAVKGAFSSSASLIGNTVLRTSADVMGPPVICPVVPGSGPMYAVANLLGVPTVAGPGSLRMDSGMHAPNEHVRIADYRDEIRVNLRLFDLFGNGSECSQADD